VILLNDRVSVIICVIQTLGHMDSSLSFFKKKNNSIQAKA